MESKVLGGGASGTDSEVRKRRAHKRVRPILAGDFEAKSSFYRLLRNQPASPTTPEPNSRMLPLLVSSVWFVRTWELGGYY